MNFDDLYPSKYLKQSDVGDEEVIVTIVGIKREAMKDKGEDIEKPIIKFAEFDKPMVLAKINGQRIATAHGHDISQWKGKQMVLYVNPDVTFGNEVTGGLRLKPVQQPKAKVPAKTNDFSDDVPF